MTDERRQQIVVLLPRLRRFACALTGDAERGDDLVQETCVRALAKLHQWQSGTRLDSWLFKIAQNLWFDRIRAGKLRGESVLIDTVEIAGEDGREVTESRLTFEVVSAALEKLPPDQKVVLVLVCVDGLSYKEAAEVLEIPIGTVMSRLARGRRSLAEAASVAPQTTEPTRIATHRVRSV